MQSFRSANSMGYRVALYLAFAALFLLFAGPLLSQLQAQGHATAHAHGQHATHPMPSPAPSPHDHDPLHHWYHQCDYCGLWQHTPTAPSHLPAIGSTAFPSRTPLPSVFAPRAAVSRHYPHAHSRAPPAPRLV